MSNDYALYRQKLATPESAVARVKNGDTIVHVMAVAEPPALLAPSSRTPGRS